MSDMLQLIQENPGVYWSVRTRVPMTDAWGRPVLTERGVPRTTFNTKEPERDFKADLTERGLASGLTLSEAEIVVKRALEVQSDVLDTDRGGMYSTVEVADAMFSLARDLRGVK